MTKKEYNNIVDLRTQLEDIHIQMGHEIKIIQKNEFGLARAELERLIKTYPHGERAKRAQARLLSLPSLPREERSNESK